MAGKLDGKVAIVTGASSGMGTAMTRRLARDGAAVIVHYVGRQEGAEALVTDVREAGGKAEAVGADLTQADAVPHLLQAAETAFGGLDILVNNAGIFTAHPITEVGYAAWQEHWRSTLGVNLVGAANVTWCAVRHMKEQERGGRIVNVSSRGAFRGEPDVPAYGASKAALNSLTQSLAIALAPYRIAVSAVAPGFVATDMTTDWLTPPGGDEIRAQSPFGRVAEPDEIAAGVLYLASAQAEWASGTILDLNGASYLRT